MREPFSFRHELDPDLFALDRLDHLLRTAPPGKAHVRTADTDKERTSEPHDVELDEPLADALATRSLHVYLQDLPEWATEFRPARDHVLDAAGVDRTEKHYIETCNIRIFSGDAPVSLHADGETQFNCGIAGRNVWHFAAPELVTDEEHEWLLRGGQFLPWRELGETRTFDLAPGDACAAPPRWPHWLEHPGSEPAVSFEAGYWTAQAVRERKVYEVNWLIRKTRLIHPRPPHAGNDAVKQKVFDAVSLATRKGAEIRGV
ncbi:MAG TPA: hypothetical protein VGN06_04840 [Gaiellaceae bacterium]|jgi:mannose-6-phosphate isomerase-like protein (cupin superfamily)